MWKARAVAVCVAVFMVGCTRSTESANTVPVEPVPAIATSPAAVQPVISIAEAPSDGDSIGKTIKLLSQTQPELLLMNLPLEKAFGELKTAGTPLPIDVAWDQLPADVTKQTPVTIRLRNTKLSGELRTVLTTDARLAYTIRSDGRIIVSVRSDLYARFAKTCRYPVASIIPPDRRNNPAMIADISYLVTQTIAPDSWNSDDHSGGQLTSDGQTLVIRQTPDVHYQIHELLHKLWEMHHFDE